MPIRATELRRRRVRQAKLAKLRRRYLAATSDQERRAVLDKLGRVARWLTVEQFLAPLGASAPAPPRSAERPRSSR